MAISTFFKSNASNIQSHAVEFLLHLEKNFFQSKKSLWINFDVLEFTPNLTSLKSNQRNQGSLVFLALIKPIYVCGK